MLLINKMDTEGADEKYKEIREDLKNIAGKCSLSIFNFFTINFSTRTQILCDTVILCYFQLSCLSMKKSLDQKFR